MGPVRARYPGRLLPAVLAAASMLLALTGPVAAKPAAASLSASPNPLAFAAVTNLGAACADGGCTHALLSITNGKGAPQTITSVDYSAPFFPTWGGTCNDAAHAGIIKAHQTCTFEWAYQPTSLQAVSAQADIYFESGAMVTFSLSGPPSQ